MSYRTKKKEETRKTRQVSIHVEETVTIREKVRIVSHYHRAELLNRRQITLLLKKIEEAFREMSEKDKNLKEKIGKEALKKWQKSNAMQGFSCEL